MIAVKSRGLWWKALAFAVVAVPWFLRDQLATSLEQDTRTAQLVLDKLQAQAQKQQTDRDQRDTLNRLASIETALLVLTKEVTKAESEDHRYEALIAAIQDDARALGESAAAFDKFAESPEMHLPAANIAELKKYSAHAAEVAAATAKAAEGGNADQINALLGKSNEAEGLLGEAYEHLAQVTEARRVDSASGAKVTRYLAWLFTAIAALMVGDWKKLLGGSGSEDDEDGEAATKA